MKKFVLILIYVIAVLAIDLFARDFWPISLFHFRFKNGFDLGKFLTWFLIPFLLCARSFDLKWIRLNIPKKDLLILGLITVGGIGVMLLIPHVESLSRYYHSYGAYPPAFRKMYFIRQLWWNLSWLVGWEFMHRYFLLKTAKKEIGRHALWLIPLIECLYHVEKAPIEMVGMLFFGALLTYWAYQRENILYPMLGHLIIELELIGFQIL